MLTGKLLRRASLLGLILSLACEDSTAPTMASVAGSYHATSFTTTEGTVTTDQLQEGAGLVLVLASGGTVTGTLAVPNDGVDANMAGTWALNGSTVTFDQSADTFVNDMNFTVQGNTLVGDQTFSGVRVQVTLERSSPFLRSQ